MNKEMRGKGENRKVYTSTNKRNQRSTVFASPSKFQSPFQLCDMESELERKQKSFLSHKWNKQLLKYSGLTFWLFLFSSMMFHSVCFDSAFFAGVILEIWEANRKDKKSPANTLEVHCPLSLLPFF